MKIHHVRLLASLTLIFASCSTYEEVRLPTFDAAMAIDTTLPNPAFYTVAQVPRDLPLAVPFAQVLGNFPSDYNEIDQGWRLSSECTERGFRPDFVVFQARGLAAGGNELQVSSVFSSCGIYGLGFSTTPTTRNTAAVTCYRLAPVSLGLMTDASWMVTEVAESAKPSGIQEGDWIQMIGTADVQPRASQDVAPWLAASLQRKPGDKIEVVWIRPGTGRMRGEIVLGARKPMPDDAKALPLPEWYRARVGH
jgi:hypothetical protein